MGHLRESGDPWHKAAHFPTFYDEGCHTLLVCKYTFTIHYARYNFMVYFAVIIRILQLLQKRPVLLSLEVPSRVNNTRKRHVSDHFTSFTIEMGTSYKGLISILRCSKLCIFAPKHASLRF